MCCSIIYYILILITIVTVVVIISIAFLVNRRWVLKNKIELERIKNEFAQNEFQRKKEYLELNKKSNDAKTNNEQPKTDK